MTPIATEHKADTLTQRDVRWVLLFVTALIVNFGCALLFSQLATSGFSWPAFLMCLLPMFCAAYLLSIYRSFLERVICWAAVVGAGYWGLQVLAMFGISVSLW